MIVASLLGYTLTCARCVSQLNVTIRYQSPANNVHGEQEANNVHGVFAGDSSFLDVGGTTGKDLWVGGMPDSFTQGTIEETEERLQELCSKFGRVQSVTVRKKKLLGSWGLVTFEKTECMTQAVATGLTTADGTVLRVAEADVHGKLGAGNAAGMLFHVARHHGLKRMRPGIIHLTIDSGEELAPSGEFISDLTTYVDYTELLRGMGVLFGYLLFSFIFYRVSAGLHVY